MQTAATHAELWIVWAADVGQWFSTMLSTNQPGYSKTVYLWFLGMSASAEMHSNASAVPLLWKRLIAQKPDAPVYYLMVVPVSWQMFTLANLFLFSPQQPVNHQCSGISFIFPSPMCRTGKHVVKILSKLSQLTEKCTVNTRQTYCGGADEVGSIKTSHFYWYLSNCIWFSWPMNSTFSYFCFFVKTQKSIHCTGHKVRNHWFGEVLYCWHDDRVKW